MSDTKDEKKQVLIRVRQPVFDQLFSDAVEETRARRERVSVPSLVVDRLEAIDEMGALPAILATFAQEVERAVAEGRDSVNVPLTLALRLARLLPQGYRDDNVGETQKGS
jgi:hypothetical protein